MRTKPEVGAVFTFDFQSDVHRGRYRLVEQTGRDTWVAEHVEPSDEEIESVLSDPYYAVHDPARAEQEALERIDRTGEKFEVRFVSHEQWAAMF